jgi:anti-sigma B factor antagonist
VIGVSKEAGGRSPSTPEERLSVRTEPQPGGRVLVVSVEGEIDQATTGLLRGQVISVARSASPPRLVLDLDRVTFCDVSALGALVAIRNAVLARDGAVVIARPPGMCRRILRRTGLDQHIPITATLERAITDLSC